MNSGKEMWLREMRALPPGQALDALAHTILRLEDRVRELEARPAEEAELTGVSWWGFGTIWVKL